MNVALTAMLERAAEIHGIGPWRTVYTDTENADGIAPVCLDPDHPIDHDIRDCCTGTDIETFSVKLADYMAALLTYAPSLLTEHARLQAIEFVHQGCAGLRERDNAELIRQRDEALAEVAHLAAQVTAMRAKAQRFAHLAEQAQVAYERQPGATASACARITASFATGFWSVAALDSVP